MMGSQETDEVLMDFMEQHPQQRRAVLSGRTHSSGSARIRDNLEVFCGDAEFGQPVDGSRTVTRQRCFTGQDRWRALAKWSLKEFAH